MEQGYAVATSDAWAAARYPTYPYVIASPWDQYGLVAYLYSKTAIQHLKPEDRILRWPT